MDWTLETRRATTKKISGQNNKNVKETRRVSTEGQSYIKQTNAIKKGLLAEIKGSWVVWVKLRSKSAWTI